MAVDGLRSRELSPLDSKIGDIGGHAQRVGMIRPEPAREDLGCSFVASEGLVGAIQAPEQHRIVARDRGDLDVVRTERGHDDRDGLLVQLECRLVLALAAELLGDVGERGADERIPGIEHAVQGLERATMVRERLVVTSEAMKHRADAVVGGRDREAVGAALGLEQIAGAAMVFEPLLVVSDGDERGAKVALQIRLDASIAARRLEARQRHLRAERRKLAPPRAGSTSPTSAAQAGFQHGARAGPCGHGRLLERSLGFGRSTELLLHCVFEREGFGPQRIVAQLDGGVLHLASQLERWRVSARLPSSAGFGEAFSGGLQLAGEARLARYPRHGARSRGRRRDAKRDVKARSEPGMTTSARYALISAVAAWLLASYWLAAWLSAVPTLKGRADFSDLLTGALLGFGAIGLLAYAVFKFWPTWYRRLASAIAAWILSAEAFRWCAVIYIARGDTPPSWIREWFGPTSGTALLGGFLCVAALAVLDYLARRDVRVVRESLAPVVKDAQTPRFDVNAIGARELLLKNFGLDVENRIRVSIHVARMLDLGIIDSPVATHLPWIYKDPDLQHSFQDLNEALDRYGRRVLVLGDPGSGKTTTLLYVAREMIGVAKANPSAPVPLYLNLTKLRVPRAPVGRWFPAAERSPRDFIEDWVVDELVRYPGVNRETARAWVRDGAVALLLDGLDEVNEEDRERVVAELNSKYLRRHPAAVVIVSSRANEYVPLQARKEARLQLNGAVTLQPLRDDQILAYLEAANAVGLLQAFSAGDDQVLLEMARTPLTLSMMTLAYGSVPPPKRKAGESLAVQRYALIGAYVRRVVQRKERRDRGLQFDESQDNDVPEKYYRYSHARLNRSLGWFAVRMSVRMRTWIPWNRLFDFLDGQAWRDQAAHVSWMTVAVRVVLVLLASLFGAGVAATSATISLSAAGVACSGAALLSLLLLVVVVDDLRPLDFIAASERLPSFDTAAIGVLILCGGLAASVILGSLAVAASWVLPFGPHSPTVAGVFLITSAVWVMMLAIAIVEGIREVAVAALAVAVVTSAVVVGNELLPPDVSLLTQRKLLFLSSVFFLAEIAALCVLLGAEDLRLVALPVVVGAVVFGLELLGLVFVSEWGRNADVLPVALSLGVGIVGGVVTVCGMLASYVAAVMLLGPDFGLIAMLFAAMAFLVAAIWVPSVDGAVAGGVRMLEAAVDRYLFSPLLRVCGALSRIWPVSLLAFIRHAEEAFLVRVVNEGFEFVHRTVRDYFALLELLPRLDTAEQPKLLAVVHALRFQGEAAILPLGELARSPDVEIRVAAVRGLGGIASTEVFEILEKAADDLSFEVRMVAVLGTSYMPRERRERIVTEAIRDLNSDVQSAALTVFFRDTDGLSGASQLDGKSDYFREIETLIETSSKLRRLVVGLAGNKDEEFRVRSGALRAIGRLKERAGARAVLDSLFDRDSMLAGVAAEVLVEIANPDSVGELGRLLNHSSRRVRAACRRALEQVATEEASRLLREADIHAARWRLRFWRAP